MAGASQTMPTSTPMDDPSWQLLQSHLQPLEPPAPSPEQGNGKASAPGAEPLEGLSKLPAPSSLQRQAQQQGRQRGGLFIAREEGEGGKEPIWGVFLLSLLKCPR